MTNRRPEAGPRFEPASYRDRDARVVDHDGEIYRLLSRRALADWEALRRTDFFRRGVEAGQIVATESVSEPPAGLADLTGEFAGVVRHRRVPFVSYPYEWTFGMLRRAAQLQLELLDAALDEGFVVKDASAYNIQWIGARPVFIDLPSFQRREEGEPWIGYLQFCQLFLYPLMLTAYRDLPFQPWLRGSLDGISPEECADLLSLRDRVRPGVFLDVYLQSRLQRAASDRRSSVRREVQRSGFSAAMIRRNVRRLMKVIDRLEWRRDRSTWSEYEREHGYDEADLAAKRTFVERALARRRWSLVWDLGANTGAYSKLAARSAEYVVSMDADRLAVERLYRQLEAGEQATGEQVTGGGRAGNLLPLVQNIADPSPSQGWRLAERRSLAARGKPDLVLALALIHHLVLGANIPLDEVVDWLAGLGGDLVIEWVGRSDPMVERLLLNKEDLFRDYARETFERRLEERFEVSERYELGSGTRVLFLARPRV